MNTNSWFPAFRRTAALAALYLPLHAHAAPPANSPPAAQGAGSFVAAGHEHRVVYHSPQTPGFTSWVGLWKMPDGSIMTSFTQATGPVEGRSLAPIEIQRLLDWPPKDHSKNYDMTGLDLRNVHLRSADSGATWQKVSADAFKSNMNGITGESEVAFSDGTIVRGVWGQYLPFNPEIPQTGFLQRSLDKSVTWGPPEVFLDPKKFQTYPKRLRVLRDGRLVMGGGIVYKPAGTLNREAMDKFIEPLLMVSSDQGKTWKGPIAVVPPANRANWGGEEFDFAELPSGDLLCVFRRPDPDSKVRKEVRWQGLLKKTGDSWTPVEARPAPFPHSGHPELLATREGPILHIATTGIHWTNDSGATWHQLEIPGSAYYPRSIQTDDGRILVLGHIGHDDAYGAVDQSVVMDSFRLVKK